MKGKRDLDTIMGASGMTFDQMSLVRGAQEELALTQNRLYTAEQLYKQAMQVLIGAVQASGGEIRIPPVIYYGIEQGTHLDVSEDTITKDIILKTCPPEKEQEKAV